MTIKAQPGTPDPTSPRLGLHVINAGYGESILLEMPGNRWGVVDCYSPRPRQADLNPTLQFLRERGISQLEFVALTHPHADHYQGIQNLLDHLETKAFWWFAGITPLDLPRLVNGLREGVGEQKTQDRSRQRSIRFLDKMFATARQQQSAGTLQITQMSNFAELYPLPVGGKHPPDTIRIYALAPHTDTLQRYEAELHRCFEDEHLKQKMAVLNHNQISAALLVEYGETRLILGGDVEAESWEEVLKRVSDTRLRANAVKVSHHGSRNGYCAGLWSLFCKDSPTLAVIAPSHPHSLPDQEAVEHIRRAGAQLTSTCTPALSFSTDANFESWEAYEAGVQLALRAVFPSFKAEKPFPLGTCSFWFDAQGQVVETILTGSASIL